MKYTTLGDLNLYLNHILHDPGQQALLSGLLSWQLFGPVLRDQHAALLKLPPALVSEGKALAAELREADAEHDATYRAIYFLLRAYQDLPPDPSSASGRGLQAKAKALQQALTPDLALTRASYADEAHAATARRARLQPLDADLDLFPVEGGTLRAWTERLDASARKLSDLLAQRAHKDVDNLSAGALGEAVALRGSILGALQSLRESLRVELRQKPGLPADTEARVFQMLDNLAQSRDDANARADAAAKA